MALNVKHDGNPGTSKSVRLWPAYGIVGLAVPLFVWFWSRPGIDQQQQVLRSYVVIAIAGAGLLLWFVFFSRIRWRIRLLGLLLLFLLIVVSRFILVVRGVSGNLLPVLEFAWSRDRDSLSEEESAIPETARSASTTPSPFDFPQFLGPDRNGRLLGVGLARDWNQTPPKELWRRPVGAGWSGFSIVGDFAVTQEQHGETEMVVAYHVADGSILWRHADATRFENLVAGEGPRATPAIHDGRVYTLGSTGLLSCLRLSDGTVHWRTNILSDNNAPVPDYGCASSPLVVDDRVVVSAGGTDGRSLVAYHRKSGDWQWGGGSQPVGYSSPIVADLAGVRQILIFNAAELSAHDPADGSLLWAVDWPPMTEKVANPIPYQEDRVFVSSGYGIGGKMVQVLPGDASGFEVKMLWETSHMKAKFSNMVRDGSLVYGLDDGILACLDLERGRRRWKGGRYGHGQLLLVDDLLLLQAEDGTVVLLEATAEEHRELGTLAALDSKTWNHPALQRSLLLVRNDREAVCFELPLRSE